jgi:putative DNA methylase
MGQRLLAMVAEGARSRIYLSPTEAMENAANKAQPTWKPSGEVPARLTGGTCVPYGLKEWGNLFTPRQLVALTTFSDLVGEARERVQQEALAAEICDDEKGLESNGTGARAYAEAVSVYLAFAVDKLADRNSSLCAWASLREHARNTFGRQSLPMVWDFAESNVLSDSSGNFDGGIESIYNGLSGTPAIAAGFSQQADAQSQTISANKVISAR